MGFFDFIKTVATALSGVKAAGTPVSPTEGPKEAPPTTKVDNPNVTAGPAGASTGTERYGTFIIPDIYPPDLGQNPNFAALPGLVVMDKEVVGCYLKAGEGLGWGAANEAWFQRGWRRMAEVRAARKPGAEFSRGAYHFLRFSLDGKAQADYFCDQIVSAGGWQEGDLMPWVDAEEGGQGSWAPGTLANLDAATKARLAKEVTKCVTDYVTQVKLRFPGIRVGVYGRGIFRDLGMTSCRFGADAVCNPAYTKHMPSMDQYGWPLSDVMEWQLCGDGEVYADGYPSVLPGWGKTDYSVVINGAQRVGLSDFRRRCYAFLSNDVR